MIAPIRFRSESITSIPQAAASPAATSFFTTKPGASQCAPRSEDRQHRQRRHRTEHYSLRRISWRAQSSAKEEKNPFSLKKDRLCAPAYSPEGVVLGAVSPLS